MHDLECSWQSSLKNLKATAPLTIFMRGIRETREIQRNNYEDGQCGQSFAVKSSSGIFYRTHARTENR